MMVKGVLCGILALTLVGCGLFQKKVRAFERQHLAQPGMVPGEHPLDEISAQHTLGAREGSIGGFGGAGGGCGCN